MANWPSQPVWVELEDIFPEQYTSIDGLAAASYNKVVTNLRYLYQHLGDANIAVGGVSFDTIAPGQTKTITPPDGSAVVTVSYPGNVLLYVIPQPEDNGEIHAYDFYWYFILPIPRLKSAGSTVTARAIPWGQSPTGTVKVTPTYTEDGASFKFEFNLDAPQGEIGPVGPPGPSVAAGLSIINIEESSSWTGSAGNYQTVITPAMHELGNTSNLVVFAMPTKSMSGSDATYEQTFDDYQVGSDGTITLYSNVKWSGKVMVGGGFAEAVDAEARNRLDVIESKIPTQASPTNQLADRNFVNSTAASMSSWKLYSDADMNDFATAAALKSATTFYRADGKPYTPTVNDYAVVIADELAPAPYTGETTRWKNFAEVGWGYDMPLGRAFTAAEMAAIQSGATKPIIDSVANKVNRAGDTFTGPVGAPSYKAGGQDLASTNDTQMILGSAVRELVLQSNLPIKRKTGSATYTVYDTGNKPTKTDVGLSAVDNTSDVNKPVSTAQAAAIKVVQDALDAHKTDTVVHITAAERTTWNAAVQSVTFAGKSLTKSGTAVTITQADARQALGLGSMAYEATSSYVPATRTVNGHALSANVTVTKSDVELGNVPNVNCQNASNITSGSLAVARIASGLIVAGDNITVSRNASTGVYTITANFGSVAPYVANLTTSSWSGSIGNYTYTISATTHGKGTYPVVQTFVDNEETYDSPTIDASGNITIKSNVKTAMRVVVRG